MVKMLTHWLEGGWGGGRKRFGSAIRGAWQNEDGEDAHPLVGRADNRLAQPITGPGRTTRMVKMLTYWLEGQAIDWLSQSRGLTELRGWRRCSPIGWSGGQRLDHPFAERDVVTLPPVLVSPYGCHGSLQVTPQARVYHLVVLDVLQLYWTSREREISYRDSQSNNMGGANQLYWTSREREVIVIVRVIIW